MKRLSYIDALRGIGIVLLVYNHFLFFGFSGGMSTMTPLDNEVMYILMPLFFVISGFVSYQKGRVMTSEQFRKSLCGKVRSLLVPSITMFAVNRYIYHANIMEGLQDVMKSGYWFTLTLFQIVVIYQTLMFVTRHFSNNWTKLSTLCVPAVLFLFTPPPDYITGNQNIIVNLLSVRQFVMYYQYFVIGVIVKHNFDMLQKLMANKWFMTSCFIYAFFAPTYHDPYTNWLIIIARIACVFCVAHYYRDWFDKESFLPNQLRYIGRHTIEIYFLHYFFLFKIPAVEYYLYSFIDVKGVTCLAHEYMLELLILIPLAIFVCYVCLYIKKVLDSFPLISQLCFGPTK